MYDSAGSSVDFGHQTAAGLTVDAWYRFTLARSNSYVRSTFVGADVNLDTGWLTDASMAGVGRGGYAGILQNNNMYFDNFSVTNKYLPKGTIFGFK